MKRIMTVSAVMLLAGCSSGHDLVYFPLMGAPLRAFNAAIKTAPGRIVLHRLVRNVTTAIMTSFRAATTTPRAQPS